MIWFSEAHEQPIIKISIGLYFALIDFLLFTILITNVKNSCLFDRQGNVDGDFLVKC
jgi:hypothetical protein